MSGKGLIPEMPVVRFDGIGLDVIQTLRTGASDHAVRTHEFFAPWSQKAGESIVMESIFEDDTLPLPSDIERVFLKHAGDGLTATALMLRRFWIASARSRSFIPEYIGMPKLGDTSFSSCLMIS